MYVYIADFELFIYLFFDSLIQSLIFLYRSRTQRKD